MNLSPVSTVIAAVVVFAASGARADLVVPERDACRGKAVGAACGDGQTCHAAGFECQAGSCRRFDTADECAKGGCHWELQLTCKAGTAAPVVDPSQPRPETPTPETPTPATPTPTPATPAPEAPSSPQATAEAPAPSGCSAGLGGISTVCVAILLAYRRRGRLVGGS